MRVYLFYLPKFNEGPDLFYSYPPSHTLGLGETIAPVCSCRAPECRLTGG